MKLNYFFIAFMLFLMPLSMVAQDFKTIPITTPSNDVEIQVGKPTAADKTVARKITVGILKDSVWIPYPNVVSGLVETNNAPTFRGKRVRETNGRVSYVDMTGKRWTIDSTYSNSGGSSNASNGLSAVGGNIILGGTLTKPSEIATAGQSVSITGTGSLNVGTSTDNGARLNITQTADSAAVEIRTDTVSDKPQMIWTDLTGNEINRLAHSHDNFYFGYKAGYSNSWSYYTQGSSNFGIGRLALYSNTKGYAQTAVGNSALYNYVGATGGSDNSGNTAVGFQSLFSLTSGTGNIGLGTDAGYSLDSMSQYNTILGYHACKRSARKYTVLHNTIVGANAFLNFYTGANNNVGLGSNVLAADSTGANNVGLGTNALIVNTTGSYNTAVGMNALTSNLTANYLTAIGYGALYHNTSGTGNVGVGYFAGGAITTAINNLCIGNEALNSVTTGSNNVAVGYRALFANVAYANIGIGTFAGSALTDGALNTSIGYNAYSAGTTGVNNVVVGSQAALALTTGSYNTIIGSTANVGSASHTNTTLLGYGATSTASNQVVLGNGTVTEITNTNATAVFKVLKLVTVPTYADDTAAGSGGLTVGMIYKTSTGALMIKL